MDFTFYTPVKELPPGIDPKHLEIVQGEDGSIYVHLAALECMGTPILAFYVLLSEYPCPVIDGERYIPIVAVRNEMQSFTALQKMLDNAVMSISQNAGSKPFTSDHWWKGQAPAEPWAA